MHFEDRGKNDLARDHLYQRAEVPGNLSGILQKRRQKLEAKAWELRLRNAHKRKIHEAIHHWRSTRALAR
jgi:hypothetical protein